MPALICTENLRTQGHIHAEWVSCFLQRDPNERPLQLSTNFNCDVPVATQYMCFVPKGNKSLDAASMELDQVGYA
jgi:hypothetical protein